jgi:hypothetical protein
VQEDLVITNPNIQSVLRMHIELVELFACANWTTEVSRNWMSVGRRILCHVPEAPVEGSRGHASPTELSELARFARPFTVDGVLSGALEQLNFAVGERKFVP